MSELKTGIYPDLNRAAYEALDAINISTLLHGPTMAHVKYYLDHRTQEESDALTFGTALHLAVFEPSEYERRVKEKLDGRTKEGKAQKAGCEGSDTILLPGDALSALIQMRDKLRAHPGAKELLEAPGRGEMALVWQDPETGLWCKALLDRYCTWRGWGTISDLKSTDDASPRGFMKTVVNYNYHTRAAYYLDGLDVIAPANRRFAWIVQEKDAPYEIGMYEPDDECLKEGRRVYRALLNQYAQSKKSNEWPGYSPGLEPLSLPAWAIGA